MQTIKMFGVDLKSKMNTVNISRWIYMTLTTHGFFLKKKQLNIWDTLYKGIPFFVQNLFKKSIKKACILWK